MQVHETFHGLFLASACLLPAPQGHHALLVAAHFDGGHRHWLGCNVLGSCSQYRAHGHGGQSGVGVGVDLVGPCWLVEFENGAGALGHHSGCDARGHDHVSFGRVIHDDASTREFGWRKALP